MTHNGTTVGLDDRRQLAGVEVSGRYPAWQLIVPDTVMTSVSDVSIENSSKSQQR